jgi:hypothetical protein
VRAFRMSRRCFTAAPSCSGFNFSACRYRSFRVSFGTSLLPPKDTPGGSEANNFIKPFRASATDTHALIRATHALPSALIRALPSPLLPDDPGAPLKLPAALFSASAPVTSSCNGNRKIHSRDSSEARSPCEPLRGPPETRTRRLSCAEAASNAVSHLT